MTWTSIFIAGFITYLTRMGMITLIDKNVFNENFRKILKKSLYKKYAKPRHPHKNRRKNKAKQFYALATCLY